ncbi:MAG: integral membrane protein, YjbE family [Actinobacteria bacterium]|nr:integral membrane protein, YjbE family [Actinomycetota bacterium]MBM2828755.1 integral rane protein, YjbE family [Actinomycetota bacterium]
MGDFGWFGRIFFDGYFFPAVLSAVTHDFGWLGWISFDYTFLSALLSVILIDLVLAGDNAVVIALAVRNLPGKQRKWGIILGSGAAVLLRVACTFFAAQMLRIMFLKFIGGALIAWIAVKLLTQGHGDEKAGEASNLRQAVKLIVIADIVMSLDNMLAVAGASKGNAFLLLFGLGLSIPLVVGTSTLLSMLMDKYPVIVIIGSAVLGKVAGEMMITDPWIQKTFQIPPYAVYVVEAVFAVGVVVVGKLLVKRKKAKMETEEAANVQVEESGPEKAPETEK